MSKSLRVYQAIILAVFHAALLFAFVNGAAWVLLTVRPSDPITLTYGKIPLSVIYPGRTREDVRELLRETWTRRPAFDPFLVSRERRFRGHFVNVSPEGFRLVRDQAPWPPDPARLNVFVFGGSTAFGYGVADEETIASALQPQLAALAAPRAVACYNFGRGGYYSTQERILFEELLASGQEPDLAVFVDGLNEFAFEQPWLAASLHNVLATPVKSAARMLVDQLPLTRLLAERKAAREVPAPGSVAGYNDKPRLEGNIARYLANRRLVTVQARARRVEVLFVWQPIPLYAYDLSAHAFGAFDFAHNNYARFGYPMFAPRQPTEPDFFWAADLQKDLHEPLYVDQVHYTAAMNARLAKAIARTLDERQLLRGALARRPPV
jgi:lysophospholipase L1-like esterase